MSDDLPSWWPQADVREYDAWVAFLMRAISRGRVDDDCERDDMRAEVCVPTGVTVH
jgi:hypothetical protein